MTHQDFNELLISLNRMILNNSFLLFCCTLVWVSLKVRSQMFCQSNFFFSLQTVRPVGALHASHCAVNLSRSIRTSCSSTRYDIRTSVRTTSWRSLSLSVSHSVTAAVDSQPPPLSSAEVEQKDWCLLECVCVCVSMHDEAITG